MNDTADGFGGLVWFLAVVMGITWLVFPFIVVAKFNELASLLRRIAKNTQPPSPPAKATPPQPPIPEPRAKSDINSPDPEDVLRVEETLRRISPDNPEKLP